MTFLLETDFTVRRQTGPGETNSRNRDTAKEAGSGAEFARSLASAETEAPESDAPKQLIIVSPDRSGAASILMDQQAPAEVPEPDETAGLETPLDVKSDIRVDGIAAEGDAELILADGDAADKALMATDPQQAAAMSSAPTPNLAPSPAPVTALPQADGELSKSSDKVATNASMPASPQATLPGNQPQQAEASGQTPEPLQPVAADTVPDTPPAANMTTVGVAQVAATKVADTPVPRSEKAVTAPAAAHTPRTAEATPDTKVRHDDKQRAEAPEMEVDGPDAAALSALSAEHNSATKAVATQDKAASVDTAAMTMTAAAPPPVATQSAAPTAPPVMAPTNALVSATPAEVVDILSDSLASPDEKKNHVHIQLDPPELGRVSLDFKFDAHGLQHVTIVGETPEAMRQLRLMHFELVNALERQGLSSENMSYQQQQTPQDPGQQAGRDPSRSQPNTSGSTSPALPELVAQNTIQSRPTSIAGLNIKL